MRFRIYGAQLNVGFYAEDYVATENPQILTSITPIPNPQATIIWGTTTATEDTDPGWTTNGALFSPGDVMTVMSPPQVGGDPATPTVPPRQWTMTALWRLDRYPVTGVSWLFDLGGFGVQITADGRIGWNEGGITTASADPLPLGRWLPMSIIANGDTVTISLDNITIGNFAQGATVPKQAVLGGEQGGFRVAHLALYGVALSAGATLHLYQYLLEVGRRMNIPVAVVSPDDPALYPIAGTDNFRTGSQLYDAVFTRPTVAWK